jgi:radial spoke head protein 3
LVVYLYLFVYTDRPVEVDANTQTEAYLDRPPSPLFVPAKSGADAASQVDVAEIFDFDSECAPLLEVLVGKTLQTSMLEVMEEEELAAIRRRQDEFEEERNAELLEVQRLEAEAARKFAEKSRRMAQEKERKRLQAELKEKVAARSFARTYLSEMNATVFSDLERDGAFFDPVKKEVQDVFLPWLFDSVAAQATSVATAHRVADDLIRSALAAAAALHAEAKQAEDKAKAEAQAKKTAAQTASSETKKE